MAKIFKPMTKKEIIPRSIKNVELQIDELEKVTKELRNKVDKLKEELRAILKGKVDFIK
jgi:uncharacterized coiled-coil DUF342 family protein